jgi:hypothetical protein
MTTATKQPLEKDVQAKCWGLLEANGCRVWRRNTGMMFGSYKGKSRAFKAGEKGAADLFFADRNERHYELEIKRPRERPTWKQVCYLRATNLYVPSFWVDSVAWLERILPDLFAGGRVEYLPKLEWFTDEVEEGKIKAKQRFEAPGSDYRVVPVGAEEFATLDDAKLKPMRLRKERAN